VSVRVETGRAVCEVVADGAGDLAAAKRLAVSMARAALQDMAVAVSPGGQVTVLGYADWKAGVALGQRGGWQLKGVAWKAA
jgi:putative AlgH/UPF0301 family transcriptional regulator